MASTSNSFTPLNLDIRASESFFVLHFSIIREENHTPARLIADF